jgi:hypothetical protein
MPPFKKPVNSELLQAQRQFNYHLLTVHIHAEHAIGCLKGQFQSLRELHIQISSHKLHKWAILWVRCCIILHNLIIQFKDNISDLHSQGDLEEWKRSSSLCHVNNNSYCDLAQDDTRAWEYDDSYDSVPPVP